MAEAVCPEDVGVGKLELERMAAACLEGASVGRSELERVVAASPEDAGVGKPGVERMVAVDPKKAGPPVGDTAGVHPDLREMGNVRRRCNKGAQSPDEEEA